eukprot:CAMPEP_0197709734 /NCGR_PEP_ID=MMETSP1338-20131121/128605_1 /TAXON_ID=43686 ORGANISM="Pelagodinium beii, Strain RCC1491" /NCGR_SAMPLE_ID=MMETSP1338 /ASSEMBLY_ACC=CAM_ASM_000754 /LENGTH=113 /DNA_ID=CAMNT_0043293667 /DNA_START=18 /DNA_END=359 /DNA_ORIENTATION=-
MEVHRGDDEKRHEVGDEANEGPEDLQKTLDGDLLVVNPDDFVEASAAALPLKVCSSKEGDGLSILTQSHQEVAKVSLHRKNSTLQTHQWSGEAEDGYDEVAGREADEHVEQLR